MERDSDSNAEEAILLATKAEKQERSERKEERERGDGNKEEAVQKEGPREEQAEEGVSNQPSFRGLVYDDRDGQRFHLNLQSRKENEIPFSSEEDQNDANQDDRIDCFMKRNNSATFYSASKKR